MINSNTAGDYKHLSKLEQSQIDRDMRYELVDLLYKSAPGGVGTAIITSLCIFAATYSEQDLYLHASWLFCFYILLMITALVYVAYQKYRDKFDIDTWELALSTCIALFTVFYGISILFIRSDPIHQFLLLAFLFMIAASFSLATVGAFKLCIICVNFTLLPIAAWFFLHQEFAYSVGGAAVLLYIVFLLGMNYRGTKWLKSSLELSKVLASTTHQANYDLLTDLPNQRLLSQYIEESVIKVTQTNKNFALISFSINRLELFNNTLGYHAGDLVINSVAKRLSAELSELNKTDAVERLLTRPRPNTFVILILPIEATDINKEISNLFLSLNKPFHVGNRESRLTGSAGVTIFPQDSRDPEKLLSNSYAAMFEAKAKGGNQTAFYKATMTSNMPLLFELESDLHQAIQNDEFEVFYQPLVNLKTQSISGVEALIRWNHPKRGMVSPLDFIPIAEDTGLILPIGEWILNAAARQTLLWHQAGFDKLKIAVNLAPKQLRQGNLIETIDKMLKKTGIDPRFLELELTETALLDDSLSPLISKISERGISLSIDDFGTGYSGLSYLKHFHIDKIKIDKSFIDDVVNNNDSAAIVTATLAMAKELGIKTLAEGVETHEQLAFLQERGCHYIQGYYFSKPLNAKALGELLKTGILQKF